MVVDGFSFVKILSSLIQCVPEKFLRGWSV
jgi:hypothetical protein